MKKEKMQKQIESMIPTPQQIVEHLDKKQEEAKRLYATANADQKYVLERLFPQLKGSEDERIRKAIVLFFELQDDNTTYSFIPKKDILSWLEKQGEQKPTDEEMKTTLRTEYEKGRADVIDEMRKAAWSEEDEQTFIKSVEALEDFGKFELADWLKEHKNQFLRPQNTLETE